MTTPREPDRFDAQARDILAADDWKFHERVAAALRAEHASALERAAQIPEYKCYNHGPGPVAWCEYCQLAVRIRALIPPAAAPAAEPVDDEAEDAGPWGAGRGTFVGSLPAPAADYDPITAPIPAGDMNGPHGPLPAAETRMEKLLRVAGVRVLVEPCERGGHYRNENGVTFHPSKCATPPEREGK